MSNIHFKETTVSFVPLLILFCGSSGVVKDSERVCVVARATRQTVCDVDHSTSSPETGSGAGANKKYIS